MFFLDGKYSILIISNPFLTKTKIFQFQYFFQKKNHNQCIAMQIDNKNKILLAKMNGNIIGLHEPILQDGSIEWLNYDYSVDAQKVLAHSTAHTLVSEKQKTFHNKTLIDSIFFISIMMVHS